MTSSEIATQIGHVETMRAYDEAQQIAKAQALALWEIALQMAKANEAANSGNAALATT